MNERFNVFFYSGDSLGLKTRVSKGEAWIDDAGLNLKEKALNESVFIAKQDLVKVTMYRLHGLGRVIQIDYRNGRLFMSVVRLMVGQFAFIDFLRTGKLKKAISEILDPGPA